MADIRERVIRKGFSEAQLEECIAHYERVSIWMLTNGDASLQWMDVGELDDSDSETEI